MSYKLVNYSNFVDSNLPINMQTIGPLIEYKQLSTTHKIDSKSNH